MAKKKAKYSNNPKNNISHEKLSELVERSRKLNPADPQFDPDYKNTTTDSI